MNKRIRLSLLFLALTLCIAVPAGASVSVAEYFDPFTQQGFYDVTVVSDRVIAFAVGNETATDTQTTRPDWDTDPVSKSDWNTAVSFLGLPTIYSFETIFGPTASQAVAFWDEGLENFFNPLPINPIGPTESDNRFTWTATVAASHYVVFTSDDQGNINGTPTLGTTTIVPEPISSTLFIFGGGALGLRRFWAKKRQA